MFVDSGAFADTNSNVLEMEERISGVQEVQEDQKAAKGKKPDPKAKGKDSKEKNSKATWDSARLGVQRIQSQAQRGNLVRCGRA